MNKFKPLLWILKSMKIWKFVSPSIGANSSLLELPRPRCRLPVSVVWQFFEEYGELSNGITKISNLSEQRVAISHYSRLHSVIYALQVNQHYLGTFGTGTRLWARTAPACKCQSSYALRMSAESWLSRVDSSAYHLSGLELDWGANLRHRRGQINLEECQIYGLEWVVGPRSRHKL